MVILLHPTEQLKLVKFQKKLIAELNDNSTIYYGALPLWLDFAHEEFTAENKNDLKLLSKRINSIELDEICCQEDEIYISCTIQSDLANITGKLPLLRLYKGQHKLEGLKAALLPFKKIKIFRLGIPEDLSENSKAIKDFVWCKL